MKPLRKWDNGGYPNSMKPLRNEKLYWVKHSSKLWDFSHMTSARREREGFYHIFISIAFLVSKILEVNLPEIYRGL